MSHNSIMKSCYSHNLEVFTHSPMSLKNMSCCIQYNQDTCRKNSVLNVQKSAKALLDQALVCNGCHLLISLLYCYEQYRLNLLACFAGFAVFMLEIRDRHYWLYGVLGLLLVLLYTKFYLCPRIIDHLMAPDFAKKSEYHFHLVLLKLFTSTLG